MIYYFERYEVKALDSEKGSRAVCTCHARKQRGLLYTNKEGSLVGKVVYFRACSGKKEELEEACISKTDPGGLLRKATANDLINFFLL